MSFGVDFLQFLNRHLRIDLCRPDIGMTQQLLNEPDVCSILVHESRERMSEEVARASLSNVRL